jgi:hypothetical protein
VYKFSQVLKIIADEKVVLLEAIPYDFQLFGLALPQTVTRLKDHTTT